MVIIIFTRGRSVLAHYDLEMLLKKNVDNVDFFRAIAMAWGCATIAATSSSCSTMWRENTRPRLQVGDNEEEFVEQNDEKEFFFCKFN